MAEAVDLSTSKMTDDDVRAIATYLKSLPGDGKPQTAIAASVPEMAAGGAIYRDQCSACHGLDGKGVPNLFPSLADSSVKGNDDPTTMIRIVLRGARSAATAKEPTSPGMPSFGWQLNDAQVAAVLSYVRNTWNGAAPPVTADMVKQQRASLAQRPD
jgi:mono/diheme cytochrome c family protein